MAVLTWQNVNAPSQMDALQGLGLAGRLLAGSGSDMSNALGTYGQQQTTLANNAFAQAASQYQDPAALKAALASGSLIGSLQGVDPARVSASAINDQNNRVGTLLNDATTQQKLDETNYDFGLKSAQNLNMINAQPAVAALAAAGPDPAKQAAVYANPDYAKALGNLTPEQQFGVQAKASANGEDALKLVQAARGDTYEQQSQAALSQLLQNPSDPIGMQQKLQSMNLPGPVYLATRAKLTAAGYADPTNPANAGAIGMGGPVPLVAPGTGAPGAPGGASGASGAIANAAGTNNSVLGMTLGGGQLDPKYQTVGDVVNGAKDLAAAHQTKDGVGHSNIGPYQITAPTFADFAPKVLGPDWQKANIRDFATQDKVAGAIWDTVKNDPSAMQGRWTSLTPQQASALKGASWDQARNIIAQGETSTGPSALSQLMGAQISNAVTQGGITGRNAQNTALLRIDPVAWDNASKDPITSPTAMAQKLIADPKSVYYGSNVNAVQNILEKAATQNDKLATDESGNPTGNKLSLAQLALLAGNNLKSGFGATYAGRAGNIINSWFNDTLDGGQTVNDAGLADSIKNAMQGLPAAASGAQVDLQQKSAVLNSATELYKQAYADWATKANLKAVGVNVDPQALARAEARMNQAKAQFEAAQGMVAAPPAPGSVPTALPLGQSTTRAQVQAGLDAKTKADAAYKALPPDAKAAAEAADNLKMMGYQ